MDDSGSRRFRTLAGVPGVAVRIILILLSVVGSLWALEVQFLFPIAIFREQFLAVIFCLALSAIFMGIRSHSRSPLDRVPWHDWLLVALTLIVGGYVAIRFPVLVYDLSATTWDRWLLGSIAVLVVLEATRRTTGWTLVIFCILVIFYTRFSSIFPGVFQMRDVEFNRIAAYLYLDSSALFGLPLSVAATILIAFLLFGQVLYAVHGDRFLTELALASMGRYRGGPAKVAVLASSLFGTLSGSVVSNVVMDGPITIPMMKRAGYPSHLAAAIEAVASTGGQIMPPVMGITAFLIADYLNVPYSEIILAAAVPALLYYIGLFVQVDLEAAKRGIIGIPRSELTPVRYVMRWGWVLIIPVVVLLWTLLALGWQPQRSAMAAVICAVAISVFQPETRTTLGRLVDSLEQTGRTMLDLIAITSVAGIIIGALQLSGLSFNFSMSVVQFAAGNLYALLAVTAAICIFLGMGLPTAIIYVMLAVLVGPGLVEFGVEPIAAHMFLFYFGMLSMITPPICFATYAAAAIAETGVWRAGWAGVRLGIAAYLVPFTFVMQPGLLLRGDPFHVTLAILSAVVGIYFVAIGLVGYCFGPMGPGRRAVMLAAGVSVLIAAPKEILGLVVMAAGFAIGVGLLALQRRWPNVREAEERVPRPPTAR